ncbi:MAG TPA: XRE family transcriptional regulator [Lachnospiraceae bacterium]|nr:XRE family transcriptional regulator [Lachnospiraceae bacterium]
MIISERIFEILKERGMTQREFSIRTDISQSAISDWKRKKTNPSAEKIMLICNVLEVSPYDLLGEADTRTEISPEHIMIDRDSDEHYLIEKYHTLSKIKRSRVLGYIDALTDK